MATFPESFRSGAAFVGAGLPANKCFLYMETVAFAGMPQGSFSAQAPHLLPAHTDIASICETAMTCNILLQVDSHVLDSRLGNCSMHCSTSCIHAVVRGNDVRFRRGAAMMRLGDWLDVSLRHCTAA